MLIFKSWKSSSKLLNKLCYLPLSWQIYFMLTQKAKFKLCSCIPRSPTSRPGGTEQGPLACYPHFFSSGSWLCPASPGALQPMVDTPGCTSELICTSPTPITVCSPLVHPSVCPHPWKDRPREEAHITPGSEPGPFRQRIPSPGLWNRRGVQALEGQVPLKPKTSQPMEKGVTRARPY